MAAIATAGSPASRNHGNPVVEFGKGFGSEIKSQAVGFMNTAKAIWKFVTRPDGDAIRRQVGDLRDVASFIARNPVEAAKVMGKAASDRVTRAWREGNHAYAAGAIAAVVAAAVISRGSAQIARIKQFLDRGRQGATSRTGSAVSEAMKSLSRLTIIAKPAIGYPAKRLNHSFKHAEAFGVAVRRNADGKVQTPSNGERAAFQAALERHVRNPEVVAIRGTYRHNPATHYYNPRTQQVVVRDADGNLTAAWKLNAAQQANFLRTGGLGG